MAAARGLKRTLMRALALSAVLEQRAGDQLVAAVSRGGVSARLRSRSPYAGPLVRERADCAGLLAARRETAPDSPVRDAARALLSAMESADDPRRRVLSAREREILQRLEGRRDKQIGVGAEPDPARRSLSPARALRQARGADPDRGGAPRTGDGPHPRRRLSGCGSGRLPAEQRRPPHVDALSRAPVRGSAPRFRSGANTPIRDPPRTRHDLSLYAKCPLFLARQRGQVS